MKRVFNPKRPKVLIVDEDHDLANIYRDHLRTHGFAVELANNNKEARSRIQNDSLDLVVLDFSGPGTEGVETLEKIRSNSETQALPVIVLSNPFLGHLVRAARNAGATRCVTKAECARRDLLRVVRDVIAATSAGIACAMPCATPIDEAPAAELQTKLDPSLLTSASEALASLRVSHYGFVKAEDEDLRRFELCEMRRQVHFLTGLAGLAGFHKAAWLASALEALFIDLHAKPKHMKSSIIRTIAQAVDRLGSFLDETSTPAKAAPMKVLIVDDAMITRKTISAAMGKMGFLVASPEDSMQAQRILEQERFDLIFLDVEMPGVGGIELCGRIRKMPLNSATPIVFVTRHSDFEIRAQSILSGGADFIAKPFISVELAVKALTCLFKENRRSLAVTAPGNAPIKMQDCETSRWASEVPLELEVSYI